MKKIDFSKTTKARKIMIIATCCFAFILSAFSSITVYAEDDTDVLISDFYGFNTSDLGITKCWNYNDFMASSLGSNHVNMDGYYYALNSNNTTIPLYLDGDISNGEFKLPTTFTVEGQSYNLGEFPYFTVTNDSTSSIVCLYPDFNLVDGNVVCATAKCVSGSSSWVDKPVISFRVYSDGTYSLKGLETARTWNSSSVTMYMKPSYDNYFIGNTPMKTIDTSLCPSAEGLGGIEWWYCLAGLDIGNYQWGSGYLVDANYLTLGYTNPIISGSNGYSDEDILNNNYIGENNMILMDATSFSNGSFKIFLDWNTNQLQDLSDFRIDYDFEILGNVTFSGDEDQADVCVDYYGLTKTNGVYIIDKTFTNHSSNIGTYNGYYTVRLDSIDEEFTDGNGKNAWVFEQMVDKNRGTDDVRSGTANLVSDLFSGSYAGFRIPLFQNHDEFKYNSLVYSVSVDIVRVSTNESILKTPLYRSFDLVNGSSSDMVNAGVSQDKVNQVVTDNNGNTTGYQGTITTGNNTNTNGGSGGSASSNSNNNSNIESGAIVINNNPTFNNNTSGGSGSTSESSLSSNFSIVATIVKWVSGNKGSSIDTIDSLANTNGWFDIVNSTYTFVPTSFWTLLITTFTVCLGIVVVSFIISILIKFIT